MQHVQLVPLHLHVEVTFKEKNLLILVSFLKHEQFFKVLLVILAHVHDSLKH